MCYVAKCTENSAKTEHINTANWNPSSLYCVCVKQLTKCTNTRLILSRE